jgi:hypothetical protein
MKPDNSAHKPMPGSPYEPGLEAAALLGVLSSILVVSLFWAALPGLIPSHFDWTGAPDGWSRKAMILLYPAASLIFYLGLTIALRFPQHFNYPWPITDQNAEVQYRLACSLLSWLKVEVIWLFVYLAWMTIWVALGHAQGLSAAFVPIVLGVIFGTVGIYFYQAYRAR